MKELTEAEKEWLCDNCGYIKRSEIAKRLNLSSSSLSRLAISLGLRNRYRARSKKKGDSEIVKVAVSGPVADISIRLDILMTWKSSTQLHQWDGWC